MTIRNLDSLFRPSSVALIGASDRAGSLGRLLLESIAAHFDGAIYPVNPSCSEILGRQVYADVAQLPEAPDLAVIVTPPAVVPALVAALGERGTKGVCVITAGFGAVREEDGKTLRQAMLDAARPNLVRIVGPKCVGLQLPWVGLNASFASVFPARGSIAFAAQSGAVITAVLDWAYPRQIGFSHVVSLGDMADVDFGDMLDFLANDEQTEAILLYIEAVTNTRKFLSAARAAARTKPVVVVKGGRFAAGARAAASHTGALAGADDVYDAAFRRAGMLRVFELEELFDAVETLATAQPPEDDARTILTNGGGLGVLAADALIAAGGRLRELDGSVEQALDEVLPATWSHNNPIDIIGDANGERYAAALQVLLSRPQQEALLILNCPTALASSDDVASACSSRALQMVKYRRNQQQLLQVPPSLPQSFEPDRASATRLIDAAISEGREWLSEQEAKAVLKAYGIATVPTEIGGSAAAAGELAQQLCSTLPRNRSSRQRQT